MPMFRVLNGAQDGSDVSLSGSEMTIGKGDDCQIKITDPGVSRHHAKLLQIGDSWLIEDNGSANGTFVNFTRKAAGERTTLADRDVVFIGRTVAKFFVAAPPSESGGAAAELEAAKQDLTALNAEIDGLKAELGQQRSLAQSLAGQLEAAGASQSSGDGLVDAEALRTLLRGTIPIHGLRCPSCSSDLEIPFRGRLRELEQLEVVRRLKLHHLEPTVLQTLLAKARA